MINKVNLLLYLFYSKRWFIIKKQKETIYVSTYTKRFFSSIKNNITYNLEIKNSEFFQVRAIIDEKDIDAPGKLFVDDDPNDLKKW